MNLIELEAWFKESKRVYLSPSEYDGCGNKEYYGVYQNNNEFYRVDYCNDEPVEEWDNNGGFIRDSYKPYKVEKQIQVIELEHWEPHEPEN